MKSNYCNLVFMCLLLFSLRSFGQIFEGEITYNNTYKSKIPNLTDEQLSLLAGKKQEYFISDGNYKSISDGQTVTMQLYNNNNNRIYNKMQKSDTLYWFSASVNTDTLLSFTVEKNVGMVLGYVCDAIVLRTKANLTTLFYNNQFGVDGKKFQKHLYDNWAFYTENTNALPLKIVTENAQFTMISIAAEIKSMKFNQNFFIFDKNIPIKEFAN